MFNGTRDNLTTTHLHPNIGGINERVHPERTHLPERAAHWLAGPRRPRTHVDVQSQLVATHRTGRASNPTHPGGVRTSESPALLLAHHRGSHPEQCGLPQHQVGHLADLDRTDLAFQAGARLLDRSCAWRRSGGRGGCRCGRHRASSPAAASSDVRSARCGSPPRRRGPSPGVRADDRQGADVLWRHKRRERASSDGIGSCCR